MIFLIRIFIKQYITIPLDSIKASKNLLAQVNDGNHPLYRFLFLLLSVFVLILMPAISFGFGNTWDEWSHVPYAEDILSYYFSFGADKKVFDLSVHARNATMHYGASFDVLAAILHKYILSLGIYETRHLLNALFGAMTIIVTGKITREVANWRTAVFALLFMLLSPRFLGHSMNNPKDIPFALAYALSLYYMIRFFRQLPNPTVVTMIKLTLAFALIVSVKIGGLIVMCYFALFGGIYWLFELHQLGRKTAFSHFFKYLKYLLAICISAYFLGILSWPYGIEKPLTNPFNSLKIFSNFSLLIPYELFEGKRIYMREIPWYYSFKWIGITIPLSVILGLLFSIFSINNPKKYNSYIYLMMLFVLFFPIIYIIMKDSTLYSGWRQIMFVYVPVIVLAALGWEILFNIIDNRYVKGAVLATCTFLVINPTIWMVKNHPNEYVYFNELVGGINGAYTNYETEYWCNATREAVEWLIANEPIDKKTVVASNFEVITSQYYADKLTDSLQMLWTRQEEHYKRPWDYALFGTRTMSKKHIAASFPPKGTIHVIRADTVPLVAIVKRENNYIPKGYQLKQQGKYNEAIHYAQKAVAYEPNNTEALLLLAICYSSIGNYKESVDAAKKIIGINPDSFVAYGLIGTLLLNHKQYDKAIAYLKKSVKLRINNASGYNNLARAYLSKKNYNQSMRYFNLANQYSYNRNPNIYIDIGILFWNKAKDFPAQKVNHLNAAINSFHQAIKIKQNSWQAYKNIAACYRELGDAQKAGQYLNHMKQLQQR